MKANGDIRTAIQESNLYKWQVAQQLGIHENTFYRWMRKEMSLDKKKIVMEAISKIKKEGVMN